MVSALPGASCTLQAYGNTYGNFDTSIVAFIDWNSNGTLDDPGEVYPLGTLTNPDGADGIFVSAQFAVPATAVAVIKRVRITKTYTDQESLPIVNPCAISFDAFGWARIQESGRP